MYTAYTSPADSFSIAVSRSSLTKSSASLACSSSVTVSPTFSLPVTDVVAPASSLTTPTLRLPVASYGFQNATTLYHV